MKLYDPRWGKGQHQKYPLSPEDLTGIRTGNYKTDAVFAQKLGRSKMAIRAIRYGQRRKDG